MTFSREETLMATDKNIALFKKGDGPVRMRPGPTCIEDLLEFERKFCAMYSSAPDPEMDKRYEVVRLRMLKIKFGVPDGKKVR